MLQIASMFLALIAGGVDRPELHHFPSIVYGQILIGPGASIYETTFIVTAKNEAPATLDLFSDDGEPMLASFVDSTGQVASTDSSFRFFLAPNQGLRIKVQLSPEELRQDVALRTGWANFRSSEELEVRAVLRIVKIDGTPISRHVIVGEKAPRG